MTRLFRLFLCAGLLLLVSACAGIEKLKVPEIKSLFIEYNRAADINFGSEIDAKIIAIMHSGNEIDVSNNKKLTFTSNDVIRTGLNKRKCRIVKRPTNFNDDFAAMVLEVSDKDESFVTNDTIRMNFRGELRILANGEDGTSGVDGSSAGSTLLFRNGKSGDDGTIGAPGLAANDHVSYVWKENGMIYLALENITSKQQWRYKTMDEGNISFELMGGNGGAGGRGGTGGVGKDGKVNKGDKVDPGDGGSGGNGGNGGPAGNGGSIKVFLHSTAAGAAPRLMFRLFGGEGGKGGDGGEGGKPGDRLEGQKAALVGRAGARGMSGVSGKNGISEIIPLDFDVTDFQ